MAHEDRGLDPWLIAGSSLYWADVVCSFMLDRVSGAVSAVSTSVTPSYVATALLVLALWAVPRLLTRLRWRRVACVATLGLIGIYMACISWLPNSPATTAVSYIYLFAVALNMLGWACAFASLDKLHACQNVCCSLLVGTLVALGLSWLVRYLALGFIPQLCLTAATLIMGSDRIFLCNRRNPKPLDRRRPLTMLVGTRVAFGLFIGASMQLFTRVEPQAADPGFAAVAIILLACVLVVYLRASDRLYTVMPALLLVALGALFLPYAAGGLDTLLGMLTSVVWLAWAVLSAAQLSVLKERCGLSEVTVCAVDKCTLCAAIACGAPLGRCAAALLGAASHGVQIASVGVAGLLVLTTVYFMAGLVGAHKDSEQEARLRESRRVSAERAYARLARDHQLSSRELEVMGMLAEGFSGGHICDNLGISVGTVKSHMAHIYQKLDIHKRDELLELVETYRDKAD